MQIPCNGHVCFLLNNVHCCDQDIHAHNQFCDHDIMASAPGLPLASISRRSLGLPATTFRGSLSNFKGSSLIWNGSYAALHNALCSFYNSVLVSVLSDNATFSCTLSGMLVHHSSNTNGFIQRHISEYSGGWQPCQLCRCVLVALSSWVKKQNVWHFQTQDHYKYLSESETS